MKKHTFILMALLLLLSFKVYAQEIYNAPLEQKKQLAFVPKTFIGPSVGRNNLSGMLGVLAEVQVYKNISIAGGLGIETWWGGKFSGELRFYREYPLRFFYGVGFSTITGRSGFKMDLPVEGEEDPVEVEMDLHKVNCINLSFGHHFRLGKRMRLNFEIGYAIPLSTDLYEIKTSGIILTKASENTIDFMKPGGLIIGAAFSIGLK